MSDQGTTEGTAPQTWAIIVWGLFLGGAVTGISGIAGLIIAYIKRDDLANTPYGSHMIYAIRTFWLGLVACVIGIILAFAGIGFIILLVTAIWLLYRMIRGLVCALDGRPIPDPKTWF